MNLHARTFLRQEVFTLFEVCVWFVFCCTVLYYLATTENVDHFAWGTDNKNNRPAKPVYQLFFCNPKKPTQVFFGTSYYSDDQCVTVMDNSYSGKHILLTFSYLVYQSISWFLRQFKPTQSFSRFYILFFAFYKSHIKNYRQMIA